MAKRRFLVAIVSVVLGAFTLTGAAFASETRPPQRDGRDHRAFCERLQSHAQHLRAEIARLEAMSEMIKRKIASGGLTEEQLVRARHALAKIERIQAELKERLERLLAIYGESCRR